MPFLNRPCNTKHFNSNKTIKFKPKEGYFLLLTDQTDLYEGQFVNDNKQGFGISSKKAEDKTYKCEYKGQWRNDMRHDIKGKGYYTDGGYYVGQWKYGLRSGFGKMWYSDGSFYGGNWKCDKRNGQGLFVYVNGDRYEGSWKSNEKHGIGRLFHLLYGQMQEGAWIHDAAICTTIEDIPFKQTVVSPTEYPIKQVQLKWPNKVLIPKYVHLFENDGKVNVDLKPRQSKSSVDLRYSILQQQFRLI